MIVGLCIVRQGLWRSNTDSANTLKFYKTTTLDFHLYVIYTSLKGDILGCILVCVLNMAIHVKSETTIHMEEHITFVRVWYIINCMPLS
jgi:hypothetical protein